MHYSRKVSRSNLVNNNDSNYNKRLLSYIRLAKIRFSPLQLRHYQVEKPSFRRHIQLLIFTISNKFP